MNPKIHLLFPTPVYVDNIGVDFEISTEREYVNAEGGLVSRNQNYLLGNKKLREGIELHIENYLRTYLRLHRSVGLKHQCSWILLTDKGGYSPRHFHSNSWLSGIYYYHVNKNSGDLKFEDAPPHSWCCGNMDPSDQIEEYNLINSNSMKYKPKPGDVYLFPSHLNHSATKNESDEQRICISFNYSLCGKWGISTQFMTA